MIVYLMYLFFVDLMKMGFLECWNWNKNNFERVYIKWCFLEIVGFIIFVFCKFFFVIGFILIIVIYMEKDLMDFIFFFWIIGLVFLFLFVVFFVFGGFMMSFYFLFVLERCKWKKNISSFIVGIEVNKEEFVVKIVRVYLLKIVDFVNV